MHYFFLEFAGLLRAGGGQGIPPSSVGELVGLFLLDFCDFVEVSLLEFGVTKLPRPPKKETPVLWGGTHTAQNYPKFIKIHLPNNCK